ncbi:MBOAT family O-acyltransferase [Chitinimonas sp.]|uniref:MBOAT family O-acyltransferase n=1 Tax=Chitinimonas sp. TaxID=1934313 RepID=UPI002F9424A6
MIYQAAGYAPFLLLAWLVYWWCCGSGQTRSLWLGSTSLAWLLWLAATSASPQLGLAYVSGMLALAAIVFVWAGRLRRSPSRLGMWAGILVALLPLTGFKYLLPTLPSASAASWAIPLGISYYSFKHVHFLIESQRGKFADAAWRDYLAYICFFPMYAAGPIERYGNLASQFEDVSWSWAELSYGLERILLGCFKKLLLADVLLHGVALSPNALNQQQALALPWYLLLFGCGMRFLQTYLDFSGYTDMAIGTARLFGIRLMENFRAPLLKPNLAEFWRTWHISLSSFARDYVYLPTLGRWRHPTWALLLTMLSIGLWHSGNAGWLLWGLHHGLGLVVLSRWQQWAQARPRLRQLRATTGWRIAGTLATWVYVSLGYALTVYPESWLHAPGLYLRIVSLGIPA